VAVRSEGVKIRSESERTVLRAAGTLTALP
jgi:hypothetical protein